MKSFRFIALTLALVFLSACSAVTGVLKAGPIENTRFASRALEGRDAVVIPSEQIPFHRAWRLVSATVPRGERIQVWVAPVDVTQVLESSSKRRRSQVSLDAAEVSKYMRERVEAEFTATGFEVVSDRPAEGLVVELALIEMSATDIARNFLGTVLGAFVPGGSLVAIRSSGSTGVEGVVRDSSSDKPVFVFADRERGKTALFSLYDYTRFAHAQAAIDDWAKQLAQYFSMPEGAAIPDSSALAFVQL